MHKFNSSIFREYDIRGIYPETLAEPDAYQIGLNYAASIGKGKVVVGRDGRLSSPALATSLINGLTDGGLDVVDIGLVHTPATYFAVFHLDLDGGIMVTGSHNPWNHNGFKIMRGKESLHGSDIAKLAEIKNQSAQTKGKVEKLDIRAEYIAKILNEASLPLCDFEIAFDSGSGATGEVVEMLSPKITSKHYLLNTKIDGTFPVHHPDPTVEKNLEQIKDLIAKKSLDVGFAFDGDGDRIGVVDNKGRPIWGDQILAILCRGVAKKYQGASIVVDVKTSKAVVDYIASLGLKPVVWKTGHSLVKAKMKELDSPLSGEMSAHIFFADDYYGYDDGVLAAIRFLNVMFETGKTAAELYDELPKMISSIEHKITVKEEEKFQLVEQIKAKANTVGANVILIDGIRVEREYGWWLVRASNTGNNIICRFEATTEADYAKINSELSEALSLVGLAL